MQYRGRSGHWLGKRYPPSVGSPPRALTCVRKQSEGFIAATIIFLESEDMDLTGKNTHCSRLHVFHVHLFLNSGQPCLYDMKTARIFISGNQGCQFWTQTGFWPFGSSIGAFSFGLATQSSQCLCDKRKSLLFHVQLKYNGRSWS